MICEIPVAGGRLAAVPAVHYRLAFAEAVNVVCANRATRPAAVAVELGSGAVREIVAWLRDLGLAAPRSRVELPCMLGLVRPNHLVHPRFREQALRLQERHGLPLRNVPPEELRKELHFASLSLVCLSATDSIIEAIRSAVEWDLPVHGVDLEDFAHLDRKSATIEDPLAASDKIFEYVERNGSHAAQCRDDLIDGRREQYMAARLRAVVARYGRVLFTGGLSHWDALVRLLSFPGPVLADPAELGHPPNYERVIVDPALAIYQMDLFPDITLHFERNRTLPAATAARRINIRELVREKITEGYASTALGEISDRSARNRVSEFLTFLGNLCLMNQRSVPDLFLSLMAAKTIVSTDFAEAFGRALINGAMPWATPPEHPGLRYLSPLPMSGAERHLSSRIRKTQLVDQDGASGPHFIASPDDDLPVDPAAQQSVALEPFLPPPPEGGEREKSSGKTGIWPPCENLFYGTAYKAAEIALTHARQAAVEPFSGTLFDGIHSKATARAAARGDNRPYVRVRTIHRTSAPDRAIAEPFVYIFGECAAGRYSGAEWEMTLGWDTLGGFIQEKFRDRYNQVTRQYGDRFVAAIYFSERRATDPRLARCPHISSVKLHWGAVVFGNPCLNAHQSARWVEEGLDAMAEHGFRRCPVLAYSDISSFQQAFHSRYAIQLDLDNWTDALIRIAIQYAQRRTVVIAPSYNVFSPHAKMEARARGVSLDFHPLSHFSAERISAVRKQYSVHPIDDEATQWPEEVIELLGEKSDAHLELLPEFIRKQTEPVKSTQG